MAGSKTVFPAPALLLLALWTSLACTDVAGYGEPRTLTPLRLRQDFEATSGRRRCSGEEPPLEVDFTATGVADCDATEGALAGSQSLSLDGDASARCEPCWEPARELWASILFRMVKAEHFLVAPLSFLTSVPPTSPKELMATLKVVGPEVAWTEEDGGKIGLFCYGSYLWSAQVPAPPLTTLRLVYHYDFRDGRGELWVENREPGAAGGPQYVTMSCKTEQQAATGFGAFAVVKPLPGGGLYLVDDIRVALNKEDLGEP